MNPTANQPNPTASPAPRLTRNTTDAWHEAERNAGVCREYLKLVAGGYSLRQAAAALGRAPSQFSGAGSMLARFEHGGVAALLPTRTAARRANEFTVPAWFVPAARFFYLLTNRTRSTGSVPEAIRRVISLPLTPVGWTDGYQRRLAQVCGGELPVCPPELREQILARERAGQPLVPAKLARQITINPSLVQQHRHQTNAGLDQLCAPGSLFFIRDSQTGERRPPATGEVIEADDATINFPVCVPWTLGGDPCSDKYGVKVGRFQWLVAVDAARRYVTAYSYVMRPKSSYRGEDALTLVRAHCKAHGKPRLARFEQGVWKCNLVRDALRTAGIQLQTVWSPHQKPYIEGLFNTLWTKLSVHFPDAHVGRFRGEHEAANDLLTACQRGGRDPRRCFPMLGDALAAFDAAVAEKNNTPVTSTIGSWIPAEAWAARAAGEPLDAESEWLFAPWQRTWTVKGMLVGGRVPLFEDLSVPFDFTAPWLTQYDGAKVRCHFDPTAPRCHAMVVLAENFRGEAAGKVLGLAAQINEVAGYARLVLGWGDDPTDAGRLARQRAASALRREVRAIVPAGAGGYRVSEERDGVALTTRVEICGDGMPGRVGPGDGRSGNEKIRPAHTARASRPQPTPLATEISEPRPELAVPSREQIEAFERDHAHLFD